MDVSVKKGHWVDLEEVWKLIVRQGYRVRKERTHLIMRGMASKIGGSWQLSLKDVDAGRMIALASPAPRYRTKTEAQYPDPFAGLADDSEVELEATIAFKDKQLVLAPSRISPVENKR